jgi:hypothetical protein
MGGVVGASAPTAYTLPPVDASGAFPHLWDTASDCCWNILSVGR